MPATAIRIDAHASPPTQTGSKEGTGNQSAFQTSETVQVVGLLNHAALVIPFGKFKRAACRVGLIGFREIGGSRDSSIEAGIGVVTPMWDCGGAARKQQEQQPKSEAAS